MSHLRVLQVHNRYRVPGGEEVVVEAERQLLSDHGHVVDQFIVDNQQIEGWTGKLSTALHCTYSRPGRKALAAEVQRFAPDLIHVHNFFPLLSPSIYDAAQVAETPVVQTLHNYRTVCAAALLLRQGKLCEKCVDGTPFWGVVHGCYRDSRLGSLPVATMIHHHRQRRTWHRKVARYIALSRFAQRIFMRAGFPEDKICVKPNFVDPDPSIGTGEGGYALYVGRLSHEKGIEVLLEAWRVLGTEVPLMLVGQAGADTANLEGNPGVTWTGPMPRTKVLELMGDAAFLIMPSICYEGFPMALVEAMSRGIPVVASNQGSMSEMVDAERTGLLVPPGDPRALVEATRWMIEHPTERAQMGAQGRRVYEERYTGDTNYTLLMEIYRQACGERA